VNTAGSAPRLDLAVIAAASFVTTALQLVLTRFLSFLFWTHVVYVVISFAMLGYGIASVAFVILEKRVRAAGVERVTAWTLAVFLLAVSATLLVCSLADLDTPRILVGSRKAIATLLAVYAVLCLPFAALGFLVIGILERNAERFATFYCADLMGAALGVVVFVSTFQLLGALGLLLVLCGAMYALLLVPRHARRAPRALVLVVPALVFLAAFGLHFRPSRTKALFSAYDAATYPNARILSTDWNVVARVDVVDLKRVGGRQGYEYGLMDTWRFPSFLLTNDADAYTPIVLAEGLTRDKEEKIFEDYYASDLQFALSGPAPAVVVIGTGGGIDIRLAQSRGARHVDAVEVNGATVSAMKGPFAAASGGVYDAPNVTVHTRDGRSFLANEPRRFDVIHMFGVDTFAAAAQGAYANAESYLYTVDALKDYWRHLSPGGFVSIHRWFDFGPRERESLRLFVEALTALRELGVAEPHQHLLVVSNDYSRFGQLLMSERALDPALLAEARAKLRAWPHATVWYAPDMLHDTNPNNRFVQFADAWVGGNDRQFIADYAYDVSPVTDDSPFFFKYYRLRGLVASGPASADRVQGYWPFLVLGAVIAQSLVMCAIFIVGPLLLFRRDGLRVDGARWVLLYFACLGLGFMMIEIAMMQSMVLLLEHPTYSIAVVLTAMLLGAGVGSLVSGRPRFTDGRNVRVATAGVLILVLGFAATKAALARALLGHPLGVRIAFVAALSGGLAFFLGFFFPTGLRVAQAISPAFVPWAWGVNAGFTVVGSLGAIVIAMNAGFALVLVVAAVIYAVAAASLARLIALRRTLT
jgi:hypothetical protein